MVLGEMIAWNKGEHLQTSAAGAAWARRQQVQKLWDSMFWEHLGANQRASMAGQMWERMHSERRRGRSQRAQGRGHPGLVELLPLKIWLQTKEEMKTGESHDLIYLFIRSCRTIWFALSQFKESGKIFEWLQLEPKEKKKARRKIGCQEETLQNFNLISHNLLRKLPREM